MKRVLSFVRRYDALFVFAACMAKFLLFDREALEFPVYWDTMFGMWHEATWLARNDFDYIGLSQAGGYATGGPCVYWLSAYTVIQAMFIRSFGGATLMFPLQHVAQFAFSSVAVVGVYKIASRYTPNSVALLSAICLFLHPLFVAQSCLISAEVPCFMFVVLCVGSIMAGRRKASLVLLMCVFLMKWPYASVLSICLLLFVAFRWAIGRCRPHWSEVGYGLPLTLHMLFASAAGRYFVDYGGHGAVSLGNLSGLSAVRELVVSEVGRAPDVLMLLLLVSGIALFRSCKVWRTKALSKVDTALLLCGVLAIGMLVFRVFVSPYCARYDLISLPFAFLAVGIWCNRFGKKVVTGLLIGICILNTVNGSGFLYRLPFYWDRSLGNGMSLERSLEFLDDMRMNRRLAAVMRDEFGEETIVCSWPLPHILCVPEMGYVSKPVPHVYSPTVPLHALGVERWTPETRDDQSWGEALCVDMRNVFTGELAFVPGRDRLVKKVSVNRRTVFLYRRGHD